MREIECRRQQATSTSSAVVGKEWIRRIELKAWAWGGKWRATIRLTKSGAGKLYRGRGLFKMVIGVDGMASSAASGVFFWWTHLFWSDAWRVSSGSQVRQSEVRMNKKVMEREGVLWTDTKVTMKKSHNNLKLCAKKTKVPETLGFICACSNRKRRLELSWWQIGTPDANSQNKKSIPPKIITIHT